MALGGRRGSSPLQILRGSSGVGGSLFGGSAPALTASVAALDDVAELQKQLAEERLRSDQHRNHYQLLKAEHTKQQDENRRLEAELQKHLDDHRRSNQRLTDILQREETEKLTLQSELRELQAQTLTPQKLELVKLQVTEDLDSVYKERFDRLQQESDFNRAEFNRARYEYAFLKSEYEHQQAETARVVEEMRLMHEAEVSNLRKEREVYLTKQAQSGVEDTERLRALHKENTQLNAKLKAISSELEEVRAQSEHSAGRAQSEHMSLNKALSEAQSGLRQLQAEKEAAKTQFESCSKQLSELQTHTTQLQARDIGLERECAMLKHRVDELTHKSQVDQSEARLEAARQRGEVERQRDALAAKVDDLQHQLLLSEQKASQLEADLVEREREAARREGQVRDEEWTARARLEQEKAELEAALAEETRRRNDEENDVRGRQERADERVHLAELAKTQAESERDALRKRESQLEREVVRCKDELETAQKEFGQVKEKYDKVCADLDAGQDRLSKLQELGRRLQDAQNKAKSDAESWKHEQVRLNTRIQELESALSESQEKVAHSAQEQVRKKKKYLQYAKHAKRQAEVAQARVEELVAEVDVLRKSVSHDEHQRVVRRLRELERQHGEFRTVLMSVPCTTNTSDTVLEQKSREALTDLKERLTALDLRQKEQEEALDHMRRVPSPQPRTYVHVEEDHQIDRDDLREGEAGRHVHIEAHEPTVAAF